MIMIGLTAGRNKDRAVQMNKDYPAAILASGAAPVLIPPTGDHAVLERILQSLDGLVLTGGGDVEPSRYGAQRIPECGESDEERDECEIYLCERAIAAGLPVLGICRGFQVLNVVLGGELYQDIGTEYGRTIEHRRMDEPAGQVHTVDVAEGTLLCKVLGRRTLGVNTRHHQALKTPGRGLVISARAPDGIAEAIELAGDGFVLGVQWHPESLRAAGVEGAKKIFDAFACACRQRRENRQ
ncbi:MAG: gamma-glutamyl-gamma-aminobutyrate hydrolase family protein [Clostridia bacterium]|nr:gamma-glutamyl-gamma-aminobutyrate hydrolase family protein [Clostridia bacterium]